MIEVKVKDKKAEILLNQEMGVKLQDEIVQSIVSSLLAFRERVRDDGLNPEDADKDADIILKQAYHIYYANIKAEHDGKQNPVTQIS